MITAVGGGAFYGGMRYAESKRTQGRGAGAYQNLQNISAEQRQQMIQQFRNNGVAGSRRSGMDGEFINGEIISKDDQSMTVKLRDGGSKIVFLLGATNIGKMTDGVVADIEVGQQVTVNGSANSDGSITAAAVQIR